MPSVLSCAHVTIVVFFGCLYFVVVVVVDVIDITMIISLSNPLHWLQMIYPNLMFAACILWHLNDIAINLMCV
jgi:hypothetical protein